ncbi:MAG: hypothetical protein H6717_14230 [Polyangiaceae bacterium]|nr:hypothetical protein [Polyangiaceae bacterium]
MRRTTLCLFTFALLGSTVGCQALMARPGAQPRSDYAQEKHERSQKAQAALADNSEKELARCQEATQTTNDKLAEALKKVRGGADGPMGPMPSMVDAVKALKKEKVSVTIKVLGSPQSPTLMLEDSFTKEGQKLAGAPQAKLMAYAKRSQKVQPLLTALRDQINAVNATIGASFQSTSSCTLQAKGLTQTLAGMENGDEKPTDDLFTVYGKFLAASQRSQTAAASSIALVGVLQAAFAGKDTNAIDTLVTGVQKASDENIEIGPEKAKEVYLLAAKDLRDACQKQLDTYYAEHPEAKPGSGPSPCSKEGSQDKGPPPAPGSEEYAALIPGDGPIAAAANSVDALSKGDYLGAMKSAAGLVPGGSALAGALDSVFKLL